MRILAVFWASPLAPRRVCVVHTYPYARRAIGSVDFRSPPTDWMFRTQGFLGKRKVQLYKNRSVVGDTAASCSGQVEE